MSEIKIDPEFKKLIPPLSDEEFAGLEQDIRQNGCRVPLSVWIEKDTLLDGHNRKNICEKHGKPYRIEHISLPDRNAAKIWIIENQFNRRNIPRFVRGELVLKLKPLYAARAKEKQKTSTGGARPQLLPTSGKAAPVKTDKSLAKKAGVGHSYIHQVEVVSTKAPETVKQKLRAGEMSVNAAYKDIRREEKRQQKLAEMKSKAVTAPKTTTWKVVCGDCIDELGTVEPASVRLVFADPPYNIGIDYGDGWQADKKADQDYMLWAVTWMQAAEATLTPDGSMWVMIGDEYAAEYAVALKTIGLTIRSWIKWYETFGINCQNKFNRCSRHIFYCVKDKKRFVFNPEAVCRESDRQTKYNDKRAEPGGKIWDDVWMIPRLVGTAEERIPEFPTQLPLAITRAIVGCASNPGDLIIDPFSGSGSTGVAVIELGRHYLGIEKSKKFCELSRLRLQATTPTPPA